MPTIYEITRHVITNKPYQNVPKKTLEKGSQGAKTYRILHDETTFDILQKVRCFVSGNLPLEKIKMDQETAYQYLAAAKVVDIDTTPSDKVVSTYKIREKALLSSGSDSKGRGEITVLNAFSMPPLEKSGLDVLLVNELDNCHPLVKKASSREERNELLKRIYTYGQKEAEIIPEIIPLIKTVVRERFQAMKSLSEVLPKETKIFFKGCSGSGKTYATGDFIRSLQTGVETDKLVQSTDSFKKDIRKQMNEIFSDQIIHLLGFSMFSMFSAVMHGTYPKLSTLEEGWLHTPSHIEQFFKHARQEGLNVQMHDFDGDFVALTLRVLERSKDPKSSKPPMNQMEHCFRSTRESRELLLKSLQESDQYSFHFVYADGKVSDTVDPKSVVCNSEEIEKEIETTKKTVITEEHARIFGEHLQGFVGMTIDEAFEKGQS